MQVQLQPGFVLHSRPYRDSSLLVDVFSRDYGRLGLVARGQRQSRQRGRRPLQPFSALLLSWQGRGDLKTLTGAELAGPAVFLSGNYLFSGLYANELLTRLLPQGDAPGAIYDCYQALLDALSRGDELEGSLRHFEFRLLEELGYGINFHSDAGSGEDLRAEAVYSWLAESGFIRTDTAGAAGFLGRDLQAMACGDYSRAETRRAAKRLARMALAPHLGHKPLKSRELFR